MTNETRTYLLVHSSATSQREELEQSVAGTFAQEPGCLAPQALRAGGKGPDRSSRRGFNLSNSVDFSNPGQLNFTNLRAFSSITGTRNNQRLVQLALKLFF
jgi:hypothetical protein